MAAREGVDGPGRRRVRTRTARAADLPAVLSLVRQHHADATYEVALTGQGPGVAAADGFGRLLADPAHRVVLAVLPGGPTVDERPVGLAVLGLDPLSAVLGSPQVTVDWFVVHREHRREGVGVALLGAAAAYAAESGADHVVAAVGGHEAERQRFLSRMGFAPLSTRRIVGREQLTRQVAAWQRHGLGVPVPRRAGQQLRPVRPLAGTWAVEG